MINKQGIKQLEAIQKQKQATKKKSKIKITADTKKFKKNTERKIRQDCVIKKQYKWHIRCVSYEFY